MTNIFILSEESHLRKTAIQLYINAEPSLSSIRAGKMKWLGLSFLVLCFDNLELSLGLKFDFIGGNLFPYTGDGEILQPPPKVNIRMPWMREVHPPTDTLQHPIEWLRETRYHERPILTNDEIDKILSPSRMLKHPTPNSRRIRRPPCFQKRPIAGIDEIPSPPYKPKCPISCGCRVYSYSPLCMFNLPIPKWGERPESPMFKPPLPGTIEIPPSPGNEVSSKTFTEPSDDEYFSPIPKSSETPKPRKFRPPIIPDDYFYSKKTTPAVAVDGKQLPSSEEHEQSSNVNKKSDSEKKKPNPNVPTDKVVGKKINMTSRGDTIESASVEFFDEKIIKNEETVY